MKNGPKINQKSIKNGPKIDQTSSKIEVWRAPGQVWRPLGPSWAIQSVFGGILESLGSVLELSWAGLGRERWPTWFQLGPQNGARIEKKSKQKSIKILMPLGVGFWKDFCGFWEAKWSQVGAKMGSKIDIGAKAEKSTKH